MGRRDEMPCDACGLMIATHEPMVVSYSAVAPIHPDAPGQEAQSEVIGAHESPMEPERIVEVFHHECADRAAPQS